MELNPAQRAAVAATGPVFVAAGAGSGKTRVLVERYVAAVRGQVTGEPLDPERILMVTFTDKAAAEMESRVRRRLIEEGRSGPARRIHAAYISTIHALCARILRAHPFAAGIDPRFRVLDEAQAEAIAEEAIQGAIQAFVDGAPEAERSRRVDFLVTYGDACLADDVLELYSTMRAAGADRLVLPAPEPPSPNAAAELERALREAARAVCGRDALTRTGRANQARAAACLEAMACEASPVGLPGRFGRKGRATKDLAGAIEAYEQALAAYAGAHADSLAAEHHGSLEALLGCFDTEYTSAKRAGGWLDFEDLELGARRVLVGHPAVRERYRRQFALIMVDEYQDTNRLQADILELLDDGQTMTVGDGRQSIYGFRHADVALFDARRAELEGGSSGTVIELAEDYRAHPRIVEAINLACAPPSPLLDDGFVLMPVAGGDGRARGADASAAVGGPAIRYAGAATDGDERGARVEVALFVKGKGDPASTMRRVEAAWVAERISVMTAQHEEGSDGGAIPPSDIAILIRTGTHVGDYESALGARGVPFLSETGRGYFAQREVAELSAYLSVLVQPNDDTALLTVLRSPFAGLDFDALWLIAEHAAGRPIWEAVLDAEHIESLEASQRARLVSLRDLTTGLRSRLGREPLVAIVERSLVESGYDVVALARGAAGPGRWANLRKLMDLAIAFEEVEGADPLGFARFLRARARTATREGAAPVAGEGVEAVRIMTIHAAKGLEFPVVFIADTGSRGSAPARRVSWSAGDGDDPVASARFAMVLRDPAEPEHKHVSCAFDELESARREREEEEERRCLYVAMTRAEERLFISGHLEWDKERDSWAGTGIDRLAEAFRVVRGGRDSDGHVELAGGPPPDTVTVRVLRPEGEGWGAREPAAPAVAAGSAARTLADLERRPPLPAIENPPARLRRASFTAVAAYRMCAYRYHLERVGGLAEDDLKPSARARPADAHPDIDPRAFGRAVHAVLEQADPSGPPPSSAQVETALDREGVASSVKGARAACERATHMIAGLWASPLFERLRASASRGVPVLRETAFSTLVGDTLLAGAIDVFVPDAEGTLLVDYKTSRLAGQEPETVFAAHYGMQADAYALALLDGGYPTVEAAFVFLEEPDRPVHRRYETADRQRLQDGVARVLDTMASGPFAPLAAFDRTVCPACPGLGGLCPIDVE